MSVFDWICPPFFFLFFFLVFLLDFSLTPRSRNLFLTRIYIDACCNVGAIKEECYGSTATYWTFSIILWSMFLLVKEYKNYFLKKKKKPQDCVSQPERHSSGGPWACVFAIYSLDLLWFSHFFFLSCCFSIEQMSFSHRFKSLTFEEGRCIERGGALTRMWLEVYLKRGNYKPIIPLWSNGVKR